MPARNHRIPAQVQTVVVERGIRGPALIGLLVILIVLGAVFGRAAAAPAGDEPVLAPRVAAAMAEPGGPARLEDGRLRVWVWFRDKGLSGRALTAALDRAQADLGEKVLRRRAKMSRVRGERVADMADLPLHPDHLAAAAATGAELRRESRWLNAASFDATPGQVRSLSALPAVRRVTLVRRGAPRASAAGRAAERPAAGGIGASAPAAASIDYGSSFEELEQINVPAVHAMGVRGAGVLIGMLDSGFKTTHAALSDVDVVDRWDFVNDDAVVENEIGDPTNAQDHGTMTLSTIMGYESGVHVGVAIDASVVLAKTEDVSVEQPFEEDNWVAGIEWLDTFGIDVVSSSLGYSDWYEFADLDGNTAACTIAADIAAGRGIVVVSSAGNERTSAWGHILAPADGDSVIATGAVKPDGFYASFSSPGPSADGRIKPDVSARGTGNHVVNPYTDDDYTLVNGTSFSCPLTAGVAALLLSRLPGLTPMQVREALRQTADRAQAPDNDYGWGIIDALAALRYFEPVFAHDPLPDTEDLAGPYPVVAEIASLLGVDAGGGAVHYRFSGGGWNTVPLTPAGGDLFTAGLPGAPSGTTVEYYLSATDDAGHVWYWPEEAGAAPLAFLVGPDTIPPVLAHVPLWSLARPQWPPTVVAEAADNMGIAAVTASYSVNGEPRGEFALSPQGDGSYAAVFPGSIDGVRTGDAYSYSLAATDIAAGANETAAGPFAFTIRSRRGEVLVVDDTASGGEPPMARWLAGAGFVTRTVALDSLDAEDFTSLHFVALTCGANPQPAASAPARTLLEQWTAGGGRVLCEGGDLTRAATFDFGSVSFAAGVLHAVWFDGFPGMMIPATGQQDHPLLNFPHAVPDTVDFDPEAAGPQLDSVAGYEGGYAVAVADPASEYSALIVAKDSPDASGSPWTVLFAFDLAAMADSLEARMLVENAAEYLMTLGDVVDAPPAVPVAALLPNVPNPFNPRTEIRFRLAAPGTPRVTVYDARGRRLARLLAGTPYPAGEHSVTWDGSDDRGRPAASGVYLVRLETGAEGFERKILLAR